MFIVINFIVFFTYLKNTFYELFTTFLNHIIYKTFVFELIKITNIQNINYSFIYVILPICCKSLSSEFCMWGVCDIVLIV